MDAPRSYPPIDREAGLREALDAISKTVQAWHDDEEPTSEKDIETIYGIGGMADHALEAFRANDEV
jgi:hypothetical protein